jgi:hypothetical protein
MREFHRAKSVSDQAVCLYTCTLKLSTSQVGDPPKTDDNVEIAPGELPGDHCILRMAAGISSDGIIDGIYTVPRDKF